MAPQAYMDTYQIYKQGTKRITTWLVQTAKRCGADVSFLDNAMSTGTRTAKPNPKTTEQATTTYEVPLREFTRLASDIATSTSPKVSLPKSIATLIRSVISLRQQANDVFKTLSSGAKDRQADDRHRHFISVLEEVLDILEAAATPELHDGGTALNNLFEALTVEEAEEDAGSPLPALTGTKTSKKQPQSEYELEAVPLDDVFTIFTFFKDLNVARGYIEGVWRDYRNGRLDVMSAAVTTDTAFTLLKQSCDEVLESFSDVRGYSDMMAIVLKYGAIPRDPPYAIHDWFCFPTGGLLYLYTGVLELAVQPVMKPGHFGVYDPSRDRSKLSEEEKEREDLIVLMELLPEFTKLPRARLEVPAEDLLTAGLRKMMEASSIDALPMYTIFATQILLDIHHVLRQDVSRPFDQLQRTGKRVVAILDDYFRYSRNRKISNWPPQNDEVFRQISALAKDWALEDRVGKCFPRGAQGVKAPAYHLLKNHPVLAGLLTFRLNVLLNDAGITLCNAWGSVLYPIHLYNAARQKRRPHRGVGRCGVYSQRPLAISRLRGCATYRASRVL